MDQCLGRVTVAAALAAAGQRVELLTDHFSADTPDQEWLATAGQREWVVLTKDRHFRKRPLELHAIIHGRVRAFVLSAADLRGEQQAHAIVTALARILRVCHRRGPIIANITGAGRLVVHDAHDLRRWTRLGVSCTGGRDSGPRAEMRAPRRPRV